jgi:hypothetical protein
VESVAAAKRAAQARAPEVARALGLDPLEALQVRATRVDAEGSVYADETITIKYDRAYAGLPVVPGMIGVGLTWSGEIRGATVYPIGSVAVRSTTPIVSAEEAARLAIATTGWGEAVGRIPTFTGKPVSVEEYEHRPLMAWGQPELVIFIPHAPHYSAQGETWDFGDPVLAWRTVVTDARQITEEVFIDAQTAGPLHRSSLLRA